MLGFRFVCIFFISSADYVLKVNEGNVSHSAFVCQKELEFSSFCHVRLNSCQYCMARHWLWIENVACRCGECLRIY